MSRYSLAIDIGGTFTDAVLLGPDGRSFVDKTLTTHADLLEGLFRAIDLVLGKAGIGPGEVDDVIVHATTVVTNALIERKGPPTGLILTKGFADILYLRDEHRYDMYDPQIEFAEPLVTRERTFVLDERMHADGHVARRVDDSGVEQIIEACRKAGIVSVGVCLLNAWRNAENEQSVRRVFEAKAPDIHLSLSSEVAPQMREYLRASTVAINAYTLPITLPYLSAFTEELARRGFAQRPLIMLSNGGVIGAARAGRLPVRMIESGPAAGARVACWFSRRFGIADLISFDMGGTTAKACLIQNHQPLVTGSFEVDRRYRFKPGSGMPITVPSIDMIEIGAGGGSIAWVDELGLLHTGPESAGADPGPVCYGRGGERPCVTDADVVLGIIDPERFLGGDMRLDAAAAERAIDALGAKLKLSREKTAWGIFEVVCEQMAGAARSHATDRAIDYRGLPLLAFGGAGPVHACMVAELLDSGQVIYPPLASVLSAFGTLVTPARIDLTRSHVQALDSLDWNAVHRLIDDMAQNATQALTEAGLATSAIAMHFGIDARYLGQQFELAIDLPFDPRAAPGGNPAGDRQGAQHDERGKRIRTLFEAEYLTQYGLKLDDMAIEIVNWRLTASGATPQRAQSRATPSGTPPPVKRRTVHLRGEPVEVTVLAREALSPDASIDGPLIVEERETTVFVLPGWRLAMQPDGSLFANRIPTPGAS